MGVEGIAVVVHRGRALRGSGPMGDDREERWISPELEVAAQPHGLVVKGIWCERGIGERERREIENFGFCVIFGRTRRYGWWRWDMGRFAAFFLKNREVF